MSRCDNFDPGPSQLACPRCGLEHDFIPRLPRDYKVYTVHEIPAHMTGYCCMVTGNDPQSGSFYCGAKAKWMAALVGSMTHACACAHHESALRRKQV